MWLVACRLRCACRYPFRLNFATEDPAEQVQLKRVIVAKFPALSDTFRYFSSLSTISEHAFSMYYAEFRYARDGPLLS